MCFSSAVLIYTSLCILGVSNFFKGWYLVVQWTWREGLVEINKGFFIFVFLKKLGGSDKISIGFHYYFYFFLFIYFLSGPFVPLYSVGNHEKPCPLCGFVTILLYSCSRVKIPFSKHSFITHWTSTPFINYAPSCRPLMMYKKKNKREN